MWEESRRQEREQMQEQRVVAGQLYCKIVLEGLFSASWSFWHNAFIQNVTADCSHEPGQ